MAKLIYYYLGTFHGIQNWNEDDFVSEDTIKLYKEDNNTLYETKISFNGWHAIMAARGNKKYTIDIIKVANKSGWTKSLLKNIVQVKWKFRLYATYNITKYIN